MWEEVSSERSDDEITFPLTYGIWSFPGWDVIIDAGGFKTESDFLTGFTHHLKSGHMLMECLHKFWMV